MGLCPQELLLIIDNLYNKQFFACTLICKKSTHPATDSGLCALNCRALPSFPSTDQQDSTITKIWIIRWWLSSLLFIPIYTITSRDISSQYHGPYTMDSPNTSYYGLKTIYNIQNYILLTKGRGFDPLWSPYTAWYIYYAVQFGTPLLHCVVHFALRYIL